MLVATAGHIDHGKTSLVRALTGVETDRLPEERARGISIDLGFAYWTPHEGNTVGFVDVPGHERYVRNMLAGVSAIDFAMLVVAADDGVMPQTIEHVQILHLLGIAHGVVAITKCDRVSPERVQEVRGQVHTLLAPTLLAGAALLDVSSTTGSGISALSEALIAAARSEPVASRIGRCFRLAIDRSFSVTGSGTVVTGTVLDGAIEVGARVVVSPRGLEARVRGLQSAGRSATRVEAGQRCAVNLASIEVAQAQRGDWLVLPEMHAPTSRLEARVRALPGNNPALKHHSTVHLHLGTADVLARILIPGQAALHPGGDAVVQLVLDHPTCAATGDRFVVRDASGRTTIGGGRVIDPFVTGDRRQQASRSAVSAALESPGASEAFTALLAIPGHEVDTLHFARSFNLHVAAVHEIRERRGAVLLGGASGLALPRDRIGAVEREVLGALESLHREDPESGGLTIRDLGTRLSTRISARALMALQKDMLERGLIETRGALVRLPGRVAGFSPADHALWQRILPLQQERGVQSFTARELAADLGMSEALVRTALLKRRANGDVWRITETRFLLREHVAALAGIAARVSKEAGEKGFTAAQFRNAIGTGRTLAIQVLEFFDGVGVTHRRGDLRRVRSDYELVVGTSPSSPAR